MENETKETIESNDVDMLEKDNRGDISNEKTQ